MVSRAAYKLQQIDDKYQFLKPGATVIDLGSAPGGWSKLAYERVHPKSKTFANKSEAKYGMVISVDLKGLQLPTAMPRHNFHFIRKDFTLPETQEEIVKILNGKPADVLLSDMHPRATGDRWTDHSAVLSLCGEALKFSDRVLAKGGVFLCKIIRGGDEELLREQLKQKFNEVKAIKPAASRAESAELYFFASGFKGGATPTAITKPTNQPSTAPAPSSASSASALDKKSDEHQEENSKVSKSSKKGRGKRKGRKD